MRGQEIWFWQKILSPHMAGLVNAMVGLGYDVTLVVERDLSSEREAQGWIKPKMSGVHVAHVTTKADVNDLVSNASMNSIHICQGVRANGLISKAQRLLRCRRMRQYVILETVKDIGFRGVVKRLIYRFHFHLGRKWIEGVLAIGYTTASWVVDRGMPYCRVFPFSYFLPEVIEVRQKKSKKIKPFQFIFVGRFIKLKQLSLLIRALESMHDLPFELTVVGSGPQESELRAQAQEALGNRLKWIGKLPSNKVYREIEGADCLVLPSDYDGWGVVVSEAMLVGTPAICSDRCGSAGVVKRSGYGGVFEAGNLDSLKSTLLGCFYEGKVSNARRQRLAGWAQCLGSEAGSRYLSKIIVSASNKGYLPVPPWDKITVAKYHDGSNKIY